MFEFKFPDIGEGLVEGEIVSWLVAVGDEVTEDQAIVEVMTDKATVEITSPRSGKIHKLLFKEGDIVAVDAVFVLIEDGSKETAKAAGAKAVSVKTAVAATERPSSVGLEARQDDSLWILPPIPKHRILVAPGIRRLARQKNVDLSVIKGSARYGRVTKTDVLAASSYQDDHQISTLAAAKQALATFDGPVEEKPLRGLRRKIAEQMKRAKFTAPHFSFVEEVDMSDIVALRGKLNSKSAENNVKLTYLPFIFKATAMALKDFAEINASIDDVREVIVYKNYMHFGLSVATESGLVVVVIRDVDKKDIWQIATDISTLSRKAREKKITADELKGSTFTITSVGNIGGLLATPILNYPEVGILGVNSIRKRPMVVDSEIQVRSMMLLSNSFDHRLVDGDRAAKFTVKVRDFLETPEKLVV